MDETNNQDKSEVINESNLDDKNAESKTMDNLYQINNQDDPEVVNESNLDNTNAEDNFLPREYVLEERRLREGHKEEENVTPNAIDEAEMKKKFENFIELCNKSAALSKILEPRLKECKQQIIYSELEKIKQKEGNIIPETNSSVNVESNENTTEEECISLFEQPKLFNGQLKNHQKEGLLWIRTLFENGLNGILADDMGLGKTIQTIAFYCFLIEMGVKGPFLVIAPLSTIPNWFLEFSKFAPSVPTMLYHGPEKDRKKLRFKFRNTHKINNLHYYPVVITTYEVLRYDIKFLKTIMWNFITMDEGHKLKNVNTVISQSIRQLNGNNKLILTGTPIQNDMTELWSLLNLLIPSLFNNLDDFNTWFKIDDFFDSNYKIASKATKNELLDTMLKILKPFMLRREKKATDLQLPSKKAIVIYAPMTMTQQKLYKATLNQHMDILLNHKKESEDTLNNTKPKRKCVLSIKKYTEVSAIKVAPEEKIEEDNNMALSVNMQNPFMQLKKIANHPYLVQMPLIPGGEKMILVDENIVSVSGKFQVLDAMLTKLKLLKHKILLFSTMTQILDLIEELIIFRNYKYTRLDGTMTIQARVDAIKTFSIDDDCFLMLLSTRAAGLGLNLTSADTVIIFDSDWNPQCDLQAEDRCHRMGQEKPVVVYRFCTKNTIDEQILERGCAKRKLETMIIGNGTFSKMTTKLTAATVEELTNLLESSEYTKKVQSNGFIFTDEELNALLDRSDMMPDTESKTTIQSGEHFKVLDTS